MMNMDSISLFHYNDYESSDDDDDDEIPLFHMYNLCSYDSYHRKNIYRINWHKYATLCRNRRTFLCTFRMLYLSYMKLVALIQEVVEPRSYRETNIPTEIKLQCLIRWLSGGSYLDIGDIFLIRSTSFYHFSHTYVS